MGKRTLSKDNRKNSTENIREILEECLKTCLHWIVSGYLILIIVIMPFYFQAGYSHIGSDKSYFFRTCSVYIARVLIPVTLCYLLCRCACLISVCRKEGFRKIFWQIRKELDFSVTDFFAAGYAVCVLLSYCFTPYKETALWGTTGWYMGMFPQLILVGIYFAVSRLWRRTEWMLYLFVPVSAAVFVLGYLNRFDVWILDMENSGLPEFISTIGNINWYCGYMVCVLFLGIGIFWRDTGEKKWKTRILGVYCLIGFATAVTQGSDSGIFSIALSLLIMFLFSARDVAANRQYLKRFWEIVFLFAAACVMTWVIRLMFPQRMNYLSGGSDLLTRGTIPLFLAILAACALGWDYLGMRKKKVAETEEKCYPVIARAACIFIPAAGILLIGMIAVNTIHAGSLGSLSENPFFTFDPAWGSNRGATWMAGLQCFADQDLLHKLVGVGPDCMTDYIYTGGNEKLLQGVRQVFGESRLTNAHGEWLTVMVNTGLLGMVGFAGMIVSSVVSFWNFWSFWSFGKMGKKDDFVMACGLSILAYTLNNFWSFQQSMSAATIFVIMGIGECCRREMKNRMLEET